jgi:uncharacterized protein (DUF433 family)
MDAVQDIEKLIDNMTRSERMQLLQRIMRGLGDAFPGIDSRADICGGEACIVRTRIPVWILVKTSQLGASEADLLRAYPTLRSEDLVNAWAYYRTHRDEIEQQIHQHEAA